ncbi:ORF066 [Staphylococcus phage 37]|uniref:ORF066 n=1 Tax=Staphylococcus phage 37 TaxID=2936813 RepID=Q4ZCA9_9CAUD|nr:hypothetical protein [Staphylococcus simulans]YP_240117.1 ORF066 [Staphylococcus phage 37]AAX91319.1 ORF066 [Staphylococcus phage 37]VED60552.1 pathogenicity island protein [Staphylococcus simulans]
MTPEQTNALTLIYYYLRQEAADDYETYEHATIKKDGNVEMIEISREQHLEEAMKWAVQEIEKQFKLVPEPNKPTIERN